MTRALQPRTFGCAPQQLRDASMCARSSEKLLSSSLTIGYQRRKLNSGLDAIAPSIPAARVVEVVARMGADFGRYHAEIALEPASARGLHQMEKRVDPALGEQAVIHPYAEICSAGDR